MTDKSPSENIASLQTQNRRLAALAEFGFQLAQEPAPQRLFEDFCNGVRGLLGCSYGILWIWNHEVDSDGFFFISGMDDDAIRSALVRPRADSQIFLRVLEDRGTFQISNPGDGPQAGDLPPGYPGWRSGLVASIGSLDEVYGAICVFDKVDSERFDPDDERIVTLLSAQVGRLYQNYTLSASARREAEKLRESERRFDKIADSGDRISLILDQDGRITTCSDNLLAITRWQWEEIAGRSWFDLFVRRKTVAELKASHVALIQDVASSKRQEYEILTYSGERRLIKWNHSVLRSSSGEVIGSACIGEDISEQRRKEKWSLRLDRLGALRKSIADLAAGNWNRDDLLRDSCRLIVDSGTFRMAWIGEIEVGVWCNSAIACHGGDEKSIEIAGFTARAGPLHAVRPPGRVARYGVPVIVEDIGAEPSLMPIRNALLARGNRAMACFPLVIARQTAAVLVLYSSQPDVFHDVETRLLLELAGDISAAMDKLKNPELRPYLAHFDALTGLADSTLFHERLDLYFVSAQAKQEKLAVAVLGLERLKTVSATYGNHIRDSLISQFLDRLHENISDETRLARLDENHFAIVISGLKPGEKVAEKLHQSFGRCFTEMYRIGEAELRLSATVGIGEYPGNAVTVDELLQNARVVRERIGVGVEGISAIIAATGALTASEINSKPN